MWHHSGPSREEPSLFLMSNRNTWTLGSGVSNNPVSSTSNVKSVQNCSLDQIVHSLGGAYLGTVTSDWRWPRASSSKIQRILSNLCVAMVGRKGPCLGLTEVRARPARPQARKRSRPGDVACTRPGAAPTFPSEETPH